jgi:hypothetical protein
MLNTTTALLIFFTLCIWMYILRMRAQPRQGAVVFRDLFQVRKLNAS